MFPVDFSKSCERPAPNCSVCVDTHLATRHCGTCGEALCEAAVSVHSEVVKCWAAAHVVVPVEDVDSNWSIACKEVFRVRSKIDARLTKLQAFRQALSERDANSGPKLWTVFFAPLQNTHSRFFLTSHLPPFHAPCTSPGPCFASQAEGVADFKLLVDACGAVLKQSEFLLNRLTFLRGDDLASLQTPFSDDELFGYNAEVDAIVAKVVSKEN